MNYVIGNELLSAEFNVHRTLTFEELSQLIGEQTSRLIRARDGVDYDVTTMVGWSSRQVGDIFVRVIVGNANWGGSVGCADEFIIISRPVANSDSATTFD